MVNRLDVSQVARAAVRWERRTPVGDSGETLIVGLQGQLSPKLPGDRSATTRVVCTRAAHELGQERDNPFLAPEEPPALARRETQHIEAFGVDVVEDRLEQVFCRRLEALVLSIISGSLGLVDQSEQRLMIKWESLRWWSSVQPT